MGRRISAAWWVAAWTAAAGCGGTVEAGDRTVYIVVEPDGGDGGNGGNGDADATTDDASSAGADAAGVDSDAPEARADVAAPEASVEASARADGGADSQPDAPSTPEASTCDDGVMDGDETDVDCGGSCPPSALDQTCHVDADCSATGPSCHAAFGGCRCDPLTGRCAYDHCSDEKKDADETDVDCGGSQCSGCGPQKACLLARDCSDTLPGCDPMNGGCACDATTSTCVFDHCYDHRIDVQETDIDCGGGVCTGCALAQGCLLDGDCVLQACDGVALKCDSSQCSDHRQDGMETDVDCGGAVCAACASGQHCLTDFDCQSGLCTPGPRVCE